MGTNYYQLIDRCEHCGRARENRHIGKSSAGWTFSFHAIPEDNVNSYQDWLREFAISPWIQDEYGDLITVEDFKKMVEAKRESPYNHTTYCEQHHPEHAARDCHLDNEGHSFSKGEFS